MRYSLAFAMTESQLLLTEGYCISVISRGIVVPGVWEVEWRRTTATCPMPDAEPSAMHRQTRR